MADYVLRMILGSSLSLLKAVNGTDVTKQPTIDVNSIVCGWNHNILASIIAHLLTSFPDVSQPE